MSTKNSIEEANARIAALEAELAKAKAKTVTLKVSDKGCVQINGIRKFPFTFYQDEILKILGMESEIKMFIEANQEKLAKKK